MLPLLQIPGWWSACAVLSRVMLSLMPSWKLGALPGGCRTDALECWIFSVQQANRSSRSSKLLQLKPGKKNELSCCHENDRCTWRLCTTHSRMIPLAFPWNLAHNLNWHTKTPMLDHWAEHYLEQVLMKKVMALHCTGYLYIHILDSWLAYSRGWQETTWLTLFKCFLRKITISSTDLKTQQVLVWLEMVTTLLPLVHF